MAFPVLDLHHFNFPPFSLSLSPSALKSSSCCSHPASKRTQFSTLAQTSFIIDQVSLLFLTQTLLLSLFFGFSVSLLQTAMAVAEFATTPSSCFNQAYPLHNHHYSSQFSYVTNRLFKNPPSYSCRPFPRTKNANICCSVK